VREASLRRIIDWQLSFGVNGLYVCGSTGECLLMKPDRRMELLEFAIDQVAGRVPVIAHTGTLDLSTAIALTKHAEQCGANAVSSIPPAYFQYREEEIIHYYTALAGATSLPLITYGIGLAENNLNAMMVEKLMEVENII
jgi:N-acetylneuraminate lyase